MSEKTKRIFICTIIAVITVAVALAVNGIIRSSSSQMELLSKGQVEYYKDIFQRYELNVTTEEFMEYCVETDREQVNEDRLIINYDCTLESLEEVLPACKELRYVSISQETNYPDMIRISYVAYDENEILVCYADNKVWEWLVYDAQTDELLSITEFKWVKYTKYKNGR